MNVAIRGSGVAALCSAHLLSRAGIRVSLEETQRPKLPVVMLGGPGDAVAAARIAAAAEGAILNLAGKTSLREAAAILRGAGLALGVDTGLTHIAIAMRTPTLALFGSTRPYLDACSPSARILYEALPCSPCRRHPTCDGRFDCMRAHTAVSVWQTAVPLLRA